MSAPLDAKMTPFSVIARSKILRLRSEQAPQSWRCCWEEIATPRQVGVRNDEKRRAPIPSEQLPSDSICGNLGESDKISISKMGDEHDPCREDIS